MENLDNQGSSRPDPTIS